MCVVCNNIYPKNIINSAMVLFEDTVHIKTCIPTNIHHIILKKKMLELSKMVARDERNVPAFSTKL